VNAKASRNGCLLLLLGVVKKLASTVKKLPSIRDKADKVIGAIEMVEDITERLSATHLPVGLTGGPNRQIRQRSNL